MLTDVYTQGIDGNVNARLRAAAEFVAARFDYEERDMPLVCADVGADHAYLSIYLVLHGICGRVYATEINELPAKKAVRNISQMPDVKVQKADGSTQTVPLGSLISVHVTDGLCGMQDKGINRAVVCGMGGEVIAGIIDRAQFLKHDRVKLVLQPMSKEMELREYLCDNGFHITEEKLLRDTGRIYTVMSVVYDGEKRKLSPAQLMLGKSIIEHFTQDSDVSASQLEMFSELVERKLGHAENKLKSQHAGHDDRMLFEELSKIKDSLPQA